jgi:L-asparaginase II
VHAAVVDANDQLVGSAGNPHQFSFWRSCAKPFQIIPLLESGGFEALGWGDEELALACASHGGEPEHVALVESMLARLGFEEGDLACGPHEPLSARGAKIAHESGVRIKRTHNNCSGKHTAMLALAKHRGWPINGYEAREHPVQQAMLNQIALWTGMRCSEVEIAVDGCGAAVFGGPIDKLALAYARLGAAASRGEEIPARILGAISNNPFLVGGTERIDSIIIEETEGRVITKVGAEGVHAGVILDKGIGIAIKVEDGNVRAQQPALLRLLELLDALSEPVSEDLVDHLRQPVRNSRGDIVGETRVRESVDRIPVDLADAAH